MKTCRRCARCLPIAMCYSAQSAAKKAATRKAPRVTRQCADCRKVARAQHAATEAKQRADAKAL